MASPVNSIKAIIFYIFVALGSCFGLAFALTPAVPLVFLNRRLYFRWCSAAMGYYLLVVTCLLEDLLGIRIVVTGDDLSHDKQRSIIILNHRTRLDWMFIWMLHSRFQILEHLKIVLKAELQTAPGPGWAMQHAGYLFLERVWSRDEQTMKDMSGYYKSCDFPLSLLIFPEGTNLTDETKTKSNDFAVKQKTHNQLYEYCLHPRTTGFASLVNIMRGDNIVDAVDDVTVAYTGEFPVTELDLIKGCLPKTVHFHIKRYKIDDLPTETNDISDWLQTRWDEKEENLKEFYRKNEFAPASQRMNDEQIEAKVRFLRRLSLAFWLVFMAFWSFCLIVFIKIKLYLIIVCLFHLIMQIFANGWLSFICQLDKNYRLQNQSIQSTSSSPSAAIKQD